MCHLVNRDSWCLQRACLVAHKQREEWDFVWMLYLCVLKWSGCACGAQDILMRTIFPTIAWALLAGCLLAKVEAGAGRSLHLCFFHNNKAGSTQPFFPYHLSCAHSPPSS